ADAQLHRLGQVRSGVEEQNALDQLVGVLHLVNRLLLDEVAELGVMPVFAHFSMKKILIDGRKFFTKRFLQRSNNFGIAFHVSSLTQLQKPLTAEFAENSPSAQRKQSEKNFTALPTMLFILKGFLCDLSGFSLRTLR